jgi:serine/threonine-protein kinase RsbW
MHPDELPHELILLAQFKNLERLREFAARHAQAYELSEQAIYSVQLAVDEAFTNIVEHAYGGESQEKIECTCRVTDDGLEITLRDCGQTFEPNGVPEPDLDAALEDREIGGLGLFFIRQLMDEVEFKFITEKDPKRKCNLLRMVKRKESPV